MAIIETDGTLELREILMSGERLRWSVRPSAGRHVFRHALDIYHFLFMIVWTGFAVMMITLVGGSAYFDDGVFPLFSIIPGLFVVIGTTMLLMPLYRYLLAKKTLYAITDKRVLIVRNFLWRRVVTVRDPREMKTRYRRDGSGSIKFITGASGFMAATQKSWGEIEGFYGLPDVREAEGHLHEAFSSQRP